MATIAAIQRQLWKLERLNVEITGAGAGQQYPGWDWGNEASGEWTFQQWRDNRFNHLYGAGLTANLVPAGTPAHTKLKNIR